MPVCPVCENPQVQGDVCDVCGRDVPRGEGAAPAIAPLDGLEPTHHPAEIGAPPSLVLPDLEPTHAAPVDVPGGAVDGLEPTALGAEADDPFLLPEPLDGFEPTAADPVPGAEAPPGPPVCRYCRTPAAGAERVCARCGMRLPVARPRLREVAPVQRRCGDCGSPITRDPCPACGARQAGG